MFTVQKADMASVVEMNAASALLELQGQIDYGEKGYIVSAPKYNYKRSPEPATNESSSRLEHLLTAQIPTPRSSKVIVPIKVTSGAPKPNNQTTKFSSTYKKTSILKNPVYTSTSVGRPIHTTEEKETQTETEYQVPQIQKLEEIVEHLSAKIKALEKQLEENCIQPEPQRILGRIKYELMDGYDDYSPTPTKTVNSESRSNRTPTTSTETESYFSSRSEYESEFEESMEMKEEREATKTTTMCKQNPKAKDYMLPIGNGYAMVPERVLRNMDWRSYTAATRKLLTAVFSRKILATHSLTGKPSPAFPGKPAKKRLDPNLVHDIVQTVAQRCSVPESVVRTSITTKCADESKMFRCRNTTKKKKTKKNKENSAPNRWH